jgi:hypothetical protein
MDLEMSLPPRCDRCYPPENDEGYEGLCKECHRVFYNEHPDLYGQIN